MASTDKQIFKSPAAAVKNAEQLHDRGEISTSELEGIRDMPAKNKADEDAKKKKRRKQALLMRAYE
jgi:hypothetical protein